MVYKHIVNIVNFLDWKGPGRMYEGISLYLYFFLIVFLQKCGSAATIFVISIDMN